MRMMPLVAAGMLFLGSASASTMLYVSCNPDSTVNARMSASTKSDIVGRFYAGDELETDGGVRLDNQGRAWAHIINLACEVDNGWVCKQYLIDSPLNIVEYDAHVIGRGRVAVRAYPDSSAKRNSWVYPGDDVRVISESEKWVLTKKGYIMREYIGRNE